MLGGFQGLNVCQPGGELLTRGHSRGGWKWILWWSLGLEPESLWHFIPETGSAATSLIIIWRGAFVSLEAEDWVNSIDVHYHREKLFCMNVPGMPVNHVDPSLPQMISLLVAGSWGDQGAFRVLATWSPQEELFAFQCLCKNKAISLCHSVHRHSELSDSQLAAQFLSRAVNPFSFPISVGTTHQLSQKMGFAWSVEKWLSHLCPVSMSSASIPSGNMSPMRTFTQVLSCMMSVGSVGKSKARLWRSALSKTFCNC